MVQLPARQANNFDLLRILFAWFVIVSHSYVLNGDGATDPLFEATNSTFLFSFIGVKGLKAKGNRLTTNPIKEINNISPPDPEAEKIEAVPDELVVPESAVEIDYERLEQLKNIRQNLDNMDTQMTLDL
jgi:hypothetical protein